MHSPDPTNHPRAETEPWCGPGEMVHWAADMTVAAAADVFLGLANAELAATGQWLALDGPASEAAMLGVLASIDLTGPLRLGFGGWRDQLLGVQFVDGRDRLITCGGRAMKNVAGYDLTKFMVGQRGVFGQLVCMILRTYRRPEAGLVVKLEPDVRHLESLLKEELRPSWSVLTDRGLWCGYLGTEAWVSAASAVVENATAAASRKGIMRHTLDDDESLRRQLTRWQLEAVKSRPDRRPEQQPQAFTAWATPAGVAGLMRRAHISDWWADASTGIARGTCTRADADRLATACAELGFACMVEGGTVRVSPTEATVLRRLKQTFDPDGKLNPLALEVAE